jgi:hypothetical protein
MIMGLASAKYKPGIPPALVCAQIVPKICQRYQNISKDIELYRNKSHPNNGLISMDLHYFLYVIIFRRFLHTVEVRGSSPLSPTTPLSKARSTSSPLMAQGG